jgi:hypothetical protein
MGRSTKCCSTENVAFVSEARSRHPTCKESNDAASEARHPQIRKEDLVLLDWCKCDACGVALASGRGSSLLCSRASLRPVVGFSTACASVLA